MSAHNSEFEVPSLLFLAFKSLAANLHKVVSLQGIPEDIVCALFEVCYLILSYLLVFRVQAKINVSALFQDSRRSFAMLEVWKP